MTTVAEYLLQHRPANADQYSDGFWVAPRITCRDGFSLSVQVHAGAYCSPRDGFGPDWHEAEIGFPSDRPTEAVMAYAETPEEPSDTVYGYVPMNLIEELVQLHGGIAC